MFSKLVEVVFQLIQSCDDGGCVVLSLFVWEVDTLIMRGGNTGAVVLLSVPCSFAGLGGTIGTVGIEGSVQNKSVG